MEIRRAEERDLTQILQIYARARQYMAETGNPTQWAGGYPQEALVRQDIREGACHVLEEGDRVEAVFAYFEGEDPTYGLIENGAWPNSRPYGTIHRVASAGRVRHAAAQCFDWCFARCQNLRADTHADNRVMQHVLERAGFRRCGTIYTSDGSPRIAYQKEAARASKAAD